MGYLEKVLGNCATGVIIIAFIMSAAFYWVIAPFISLELLHLIVLGGMLYWVRKRVVKIRKRILRVVWGLLERERRSVSQEEVEDGYSPIGFQQAIYPDDLEPDYEDKKK